MATAVGPKEKPDDPEPFTEQEPFLYDSHRYYGYISGVGSGKTAVGVMRDALNMEHWNPGYMGAIVAPTTQMIKNAILPLMRDFGLMKRWEYKGPQAEMPGIQSPNGSRAVILSADNERQVERLASLNLAWFHVDESRDVPPRARQILIQRLRKGDYTNGYFTSTPRGQNHDYDFFVGEHETERYEHGEATVYETDDRLAITEVPTDANPYLDRDDVKAIRDAHPSGVLEQEVEGRFVEIGSGVFSKDMFSFTTPDTLPDRESAFRYSMAVDVGVEADATKARDNDSDYWAVTLGMVDTHAKQGYLIDCHRERGMTLKEGVEWIARLANGIPNPAVYVESNQSQRWLKQELKDQGLNAKAVMNTTNKEERIVQLTLPLERGDVKVLNREIDSQLGYDPRYKELVSEALAFPEGSHDDLLDSLEILVDNMNLGDHTSILGANPFGGNDG